MSSTLIHCATHKFKNIYEEVNGKTTDVHFNLRVNNFKFMNKKKNFTNFNKFKMWRKFDKVPGKWTMEVKFFTQNIGNVIFVGFSIELFIYVERERERQGENETERQRKREKRERSHFTFLFEEAWHLPPSDHAPSRSWIVTKSQPNLNTKYLKPWLYQNFNHKAFSQSV